MLSVWLAAGLAACAAQEKKNEASLPATPAAAATEPVDTVKLEKFMRRYYSWPDAVQVRFSPFRASAVPGLLQSEVKIVHQGQTQEATVLVSADGKHMLQGPSIPISADPFASVRGKIDTRDSPALGSPLAAVTIVEYSDFQCSFCRGAAQILTGPVMKQFAGSVRLVYKDFPLTAIHPWATPAATLGRCIHKRYADSFWPYHNWIFESQPQLTAENFRQKALAFVKQKGLDADHLGACMDQPQIKAEVEKSTAEAESVGVSGTPTLFINGRKVVGVQSFEQIRGVIEAELEYARGK